MELTASKVGGVPATSRRLWSGGLIMTDLMLLFVLFLALLFAMDPFLWYADKRSIFKHFHLMFLLPTILLAWLAGRINRDKLQGGHVLRHAWAFVLFAGWVIAGALYARFHVKVVETFLIMGLYMLLVPMFARFIADHKNPLTLLNIYLALIFLSVFSGVAWQAVEGRWNEFHEEEFLTVPLAVYFFVRSKTAKGRFFSIIALLALMMTVIKNTSFLVAAVVFGYIWWIFVRNEVQKKAALRRIFHYFMLVFVAFAVVGAYAGIKALKSTSLPDGNPKYRLYTYEQTWENFQKSPVWGKSFSGAGAEKFGLFTVAASTQVLPTHSDLLDILAQGGLIGVALFGYGLWRIGRYTQKRFRDRPPGALSDGLVAHFHWIAVSCIAALPVVAFNPIMLQPGKAFILWMNLGILLGLAMRCDSCPSPKKPD